MAGDWKGLFSCSLQGSGQHVSSHIYISHCFVGLYFNSLKAFSTSVENVSQTLANLIMKITFLPEMKRYLLPFFLGGGGQKHELYK